MATGGGKVASLSTLGPITLSRSPARDRPTAEMASKPPAQLSTLLAPESAEARERAWSDFLEEFSRILLHAARNGSSSYDETMDRYTYILDRLRADDFRRLRSFSPTGPSRFTTWLFVVARRLSVDHYRKTFGRPSPRAEIREEVSTLQMARERLARLVAEELDQSTLQDPQGDNPETLAWLGERNRALEEALRSLEPGDRLLLTLRFVDDVPVRKIATIMPFRSPFQAYRRINKLLETLRLELENRGISER